MIEVNGYSISSEELAAVSPVRVSEKCSTNPTYSCSFRIYLKSGHEIFIMNEESPRQSADAVLSVTNEQRRRIAAHMDL